MKSFRLSNGVEIPAVGYGSYLSTQGNGKQTIIDALDAGYRYIDTAMFYQNEAEIGEALAEYEIKREHRYPYEAEKSIISALRKNDETAIKEGLLEFVKAMSDQDEANKIF